MQVLARIAVGFHPNNTFGHAPPLIEAIFHIKIIKLFQTGHQLRPPEWSILRLLVQAGGGVYVIHGRGYGCPENIWTPTMVAEHARGGRECSSDLCWVGANLDWTGA